MSTLTAAEWTQRYPPGAAVLVARYYPTRTYGEAWTGEGGTAWVKVASDANGTVDVPLSEVEPLATDDQRRGDGWLDPTQADQLRGERDEALRVIRNAHQAIRTQTTAAAVALAPVIEAAREWAVAVTTSDTYDRIVEGATARPLGEDYARLIRDRDDLILRGVDPGDLLVPLPPRDREGTTDA